MTAPSHPLQQHSRNTPTSSRNSGPLARLPQLNYSLLKDQALRKKLADLGIPTLGSRSQLIRRHTEWGSLWNANVDSLRPRTKRELLSELDKWERSQAMESGSIASGTSGAQVTKKDFDGDGWAKNNKSHFDELIASARAKRAVPKEKKESDGEAAETNGVSTLSDDQRPSHYENNESPLDKVSTSVGDDAHGTPSLPHRDSNGMDGPAHDSSGIIPADPSLTQASTIPNQLMTKPPSTSTWNHYEHVPSSLPPLLGSTNENLRRTYMSQIPSDPAMDVDTEQQ